LGNSGHGGNNSSSEDEKKEHQKGKAKARPLEHKRNLLGEIIYKGHPSWVLMQNLQIGIRHFVGKNSELYDKNEEATAHRVNNIANEIAFYLSPPALRFPPYAII
jgi:1-phosphatidylinositol-4-phosphate 5-kinase